MDRLITASEDNQRFSEMLRDVASGDSFTVTSRGRPVARVTSADVPGSKEAFDRMMASLRARPLMQGKPWTRDELYE